MLHLLLEIALEKLWVCFPWYWFMKSIHFRNFVLFCAWKVESLGRVGSYESDSERNNKILFFQSKMKNLKNIGSFKFMTSNPENVSANYALRRSVVFKNFITRWVSTQSSWSLRKVMSMSKHVKWTLMIWKPLRIRAKKPLGTAGTRSSHGTSQGNSQVFSWTHELSNDDKVLPSCWSGNGIF